MKVFIKKKQAKNQLPFLCACTDCMIQKKTFIPRTRDNYINPSTPIPIFRSLANTHP